MTESKRREKRRGKTDDARSGEPGAGGRAAEHGPFEVPSQQRERIPGDPTGERDGARGRDVERRG
jgi:hypothetical protein